MSSTHRITHRLTLALGLTVGLVAVEVIAGVFSNSLALLTDAAHNVTDAFALGLSWFAMRLTMQPAHSGKTFGYHRAGILVALANAVTLGVVATGIFVEAFRRLLQPPTIQAGVLVGVGTLAFAINAWSAWLTHAGSQRDLNLRSAFVHLMGDVLSTVGAVIAGVVILFTGWNWLDPLVSVLIGALILWNAYQILIEAVHILLESTPRDVAVERMVKDMQEVPGVQSVHDLHVWSINQGLRAASAHVVTDVVTLQAGADIQQRLAQMLQTRYGIGHATLQLECAVCGDNLLYCDLVEPHERQPVG